jgi:hypothetical protein
VIGNVARASEQWSRGDKCLAYIHLAHAGLPEIDAAGAYRLALCEQALGLGATPRAIYKALDLEPPPPFRKFDADQPRVSAGNGRESGRWTSGAGGAVGVGGAGGAAAVREGRSVSPEPKNGENSEDDKLEDFKAKLGEEPDAEAARHGRPPTDLDAPSVPAPGQAPAPALPGGLPSKYELLGNNREDGRNRWNTDLPGGYDDAKAIFDRLTAGQPVTTEADKYGNSMTFTPDKQFLLRKDRNGDVRIDRPVDIGGKNRETIHFNDR